MHTVKGSLKINEDRNKSKAKLKPNTAAMCWEVAMLKYFFCGFSVGLPNKTH